MKTRSISTLSNSSLIQLHRIRVSVGDKGGVVVGGYDARSAKVSIYDFREEGAINVVLSRAQILSRPFIGMENMRGIRFNQRPSFT